MSAVSIILKHYQDLLHRIETEKRADVKAFLNQIGYDEETVRLIGRNTIIGDYPDQLPFSESKVMAICTLTDDPNKPWYLKAVGALATGRINRRSTLRQIRAIAPEAFADILEPRESMTAR